MQSCFEMKPQAQKGITQAHIEPQYRQRSVTADALVALFEQPILCMVISVETPKTACY